MSDSFGTKTKYTVTLMLLHSVAKVNEDSLSLNTLQKYFIIPYFDFLLGNLKIINSMLLLIHMP